LNLFALPIRFALRYGRWVARGVGVAVAGLVFAGVDRRDTITLPGMEAPYEVGATDPYIAFAVVYVVTVRLLISLMMRFHGAAQQHLANLRGR